jgi:hypothetical protein
MEPGVLQRSRAVAISQAGACRCKQASFCANVPASQYRPLHISLYAMLTYLGSGRRSPLVTILAATLCIHTTVQSMYIVQYCKQRSRHKKKAMHHGRSNVLYFLLAPRKSKISHRHHWVRRPTQFARVVSRIGSLRTFRTTQMNRASAGDQSQEPLSPLSVQRRNADGCSELE